jgi:parallel beta-helix repeat protein
MQVKNQKPLVLLKVYTIIAALLIAALLISCFVVYFRFPSNTVRGEYTALDLSVTPGGQNFTLDVNQSQTFIAHSSNASEPVFTWQLIPSGDLTLTVNGENQQLTSGSNFTVTGQELTLSYPSATEKYVLVDLTVKDSLGLSGSLLRPLVVADPYTSPVFINNVSTASFSYMIETDGLGWYRAINGTNGSVVNGWTSSSDATPVIQNAISAINATGKAGIIDFAAGVFPADNLNITGGLTLEGTGAVNGLESTIAQNGPNNLMNYNSATTTYDFACSNIEFQGNTGYSTGSGLYVTGALADSTFNRVFFYGFPAYGIYTTDTWGWYIQDSIFEYNSVSNTGDYAIYLAWASGTTFVNNNKILGNYGGGLYCGSSQAIISGNQISNTMIGTYIVSNYVTFTGNVVYSNGEEGLYVAASDGEIISNNNFYNNYDSTSTGYQVLLAVSDSTFEGNIVNGYGASGFGLYLWDGYSGDTIADNVFFGQIGSSYDFPFQNAIYPMMSTSAPFGLPDTFKDNTGLNLINAPATSLYRIGGSGYIFALGGDANIGAGNATSTWKTGQTYTVQDFDVTVYLSGGGTATTVVVDGKTLVSSAQLPAYPIEIPAAVGTTIKITDTSKMPTITIIPVPQ